MLSDSPAIDKGDYADCPSIDQRRIACPQGVHCDIGTFEHVTPASSNSPIYISFTDGQSIGGVPSADEDILKFAGTWISIDITGNATYNLALTTPGSTAISLASRPGANPPQLIIETGP